MDTKLSRVVTLVTGEWLRCYNAARGPEAWRAAVTSGALYCNITYTMPPATMPCLLSHPSINIVCACYMSVSGSEWVQPSYIPTIKTILNITDDKSTHEKRLEDI